jgi:hydrogenase/urease accessory protein HupE
MKKYAICLFMLLPSLAFAHPGEHAHLDWASALAHLFEPDHIFFAAVTVIASVLAYRAGRRAEARAIEKLVRRPEDRQ